MTKKFWADWQKRVGETKRIYQGRYYFLNNYEHPNRFISFDFSKDTVNIAYEVLNWVIGPNGGHNHSEIHKITLHRNDITTIKFRDK